MPSITEPISGLQLHYIFNPQWANTVSRYLTFDELHAWYGHDDFSVETLAGFWKSGHRPTTEVLYGMLERSKRKYRAEFPTRMDRLIDKWLAKCLPKKRQPIQQRKISTLRFDAKPLLTGQFVEPISGRIYESKSSANYAQQAIIDLMTAKGFALNTCLDLRREWNKAFGLSGPKKLAEVQLRDGAAKVGDTVYAACEFPYRGHLNRNPESKPGITMRIIAILEATEGSPVVYLEMFETPTGDGEVNAMQLMLEPLQRRVITERNPNNPHGAVTNEFYFEE